MLCLLVVAVFCCALVSDVGLAGHHCDHGDHCRQCVALHSLQRFFASLAFTAGAISAFGACHLSLPLILWRARQTRISTPVALQVRLDI